MRALTRQPGDLSRCELTHVERRPIDMALARRQHARYEELLRELGVEVLSLPPHAGLPDSVFVEDAAVVLDECAILPHMGAASRRAETHSIAAALGAHRSVFQLEPPGMLDGGDVLHIERMLYAGRSRRTDRRGIEALRRAVSPLGYEVQEVRVNGCLHLKSACSDLGKRTLLLNPHWVDPEVFAGFAILRVPAGEPGAANVLCVGETLVVPSGFPRTAELLRSHGFAVRELDNSEFAKAEGGLTCLSLLFD